MRRFLSSIETLNLWICMNPGRSDTFRIFRLVPVLINAIYMT
nr:MAG TPA: hypothetical protein [Podoviridae sp. ctfN46]